MTTRTQAFDEVKAEAFAEEMLGILNKGSLAVLTSVGHRTGLFDTLAGLDPSTSEEIARAAGLNERYVREWLGGMVVGRIIDYDPKAKTYKLPAEHAAFLTRDAAPNNVAAFAQYITLAGTVEDRIVECFKHGGGVPYSEFPRFQEVMAEDSGQTVVPVLVDHILALAPGLVDRLERGIDVLDVGSGSGKALNIMAARFPNSRFTGIEISEEGIAAGRREAEERGLNNLIFEIRDAADIGAREAYDLITTFDAIHDQVAPDKVLRGIAEALRPGGVYLMQDIGASSHLENNLDHPMGALLYAVSTFHCMTVSLAGGGAGLGTMWGREKAREMLAEAGFTDVKIRQLEHDVQNDYYVIQKD
ncbi:MAG: class I SAM-dependent methyltransferase [Dehalococcoidia bacterium]